MAKTLCDLTKTIKADQAKFEAMLIQPTHLCTKCGRVANEKKRLCKPNRLKLTWHTAADADDSEE